MSLDLLTRQFSAIGARLLVQPGARPRVEPRPFRAFASLRTAVREVAPARTFDLDIRHDRLGEFFRLVTTPDTPDLRVLQADRATRHLLLFGAGERLLCGHDERHWFVAGIAARVSTILDAKRALLPQPLRGISIAPEVLARRHNAVFVRQGEWFFIPTDRDFTGVPILRNEPLFRDRRSKPHIISEVVRFGGQPVVIHMGREYSPADWDALVAARPRGLSGLGRVQRVMKDPEVYARGTVRHADHATLVLERWHRVYANMEARSVNVSFYD